MGVKEKVGARKESQNTSQAIHNSNAKASAEDWS